MASGNPGAVQLNEYEGGQTQITVRDFKLIYEGSDEPHFVKDVHLDDGRVAFDYNEDSVLYLICSGDTATLNDGTADQYPSAFRRVQ